MLKINLFYINDIHTVISEYDRSLFQIHLNTSPNPPKRKPQTDIRTKSHKKHSLASVNKAGGLQITQ